MKRLLALLICMALLCSCSAAKPQPAMAPEPEESAPPVEEILEEPQAVFAKNPQWLADGKRLSYIQNGVLYVASPDSPVVESIPLDVLISLKRDPNVYYQPDPADEKLDFKISYLWSPDMERIATPVGVIDRNGGLASGDNFPGNQDGDVSDDHGYLYSHRTYPEILAWLDNDRVAWIEDDIVWAYSLSGDSVEQMTPDPEDYAEDFYIASANSDYYTQSRFSMLGETYYGYRSYENQAQWVRDGKFLYLASRRYENGKVMYDLYLLDGEGEHLLLSTSEDESITIGDWDGKTLLYTSDPTWTGSAQTGMRSGTEVVAYDTDARRELGRVIVDSYYPNVSLTGNGAFIVMEDNYGYTEKEYSLSLFSTSGETSKELSVSMNDLVKGFQSGSPTLEDVRGSRVLFTADYTKGLRLRPTERSCVGVYDLMTEEFTKLYEYTSFYAGLDCSFSPDGKFVICSYADHYGPFGDWFLLLAVPQDLSLKSI